MNNIHKDTDLIPIVDIPTCILSEIEQAEPVIINLLNDSSFVGIVVQEKGGWISLVLPAYFDRDQSSDVSRMVGRFNSPVCRVPVSSVKEMLPLHSFFEYTYLEYIMANYDTLPEWVTLNLELDKIEARRSFLESKIPEVGELNVSNEPGHDTLILTE